MITWTDSHNHLQDPRLGEVGPVIAMMKRAGVANCLVNATAEADWRAVEQLAKKHDFISTAFGIHPWQAHTVEAGWVERLRNLLDKYPQASIGECGVDGWVKMPAMNVQLPVFIELLRLAREMERPMTIHCLKAWEALFAAFEQVAPPRRFLMHSFGGSIEVARRLISLGAYFSFSGYFLQPKKAAVLEVFRQLPRERILLETDAPDMLPPVEMIGHPLEGNLNHPANLTAIGNRLADVLGMSAESLAELTRENHMRCFGSGNFNHR